MQDRRPERRGLGRGLSALMADVAGVTDGSSVPRDRVQTIEIGRIVANPSQPRRAFAPEALDELAQSIRQKGVLQPILVRTARGAGADYEIVAGERRWRAAQIAGLEAVPAIVREFDDAEMLEVAIVENVQREDLNAIEEAVAYAQLIERFGHTQEQIASALSRSRSHVANTLRLLKLPEPVQERVRRGELSSGHARALIGTSDPAALARKVVERGLSVRETEALARNDAVRRMHGAAASPRNTRASKDPDTLALEADLAAHLRMAVSIRHERGGERGQMTITYNSLGDLDLLCRALSAASREDIEG